MKVLDVVIQSKATAAVQLRPERSLLCSSRPEVTALKVLPEALIKTLKIFVYQNDIFNSFFNKNPFMPHIGLDVASPWSSCSSCASTPPLSSPTLRRLPITLNLLINQ